jgi:peptidoglycan/LPS O-acetylase OafA/YrhL
LLFFTCASAVAAPLAMGALGDWLGDITFSLALGALFASALVALCVWNLVRRPFQPLLDARNRADYHGGDAAAGLTPAM